MDEKYEIMNLLQAKQTLTKELNNLIYGSVEIREKDSNKYIYVHYRDNGILLTKYVGEYSNNLYNLILNNSIKAKELKKEIKKIEKQLRQLNYIDEELTPQIEINIDSDTEIGYKIKCYSDKIDVTELYFNKIEK